MTHNAGLETVPMGDHQRGLQLVIPHQSGKGQERKNGADMEESLGFYPESQLSVLCFQFITFICVYFPWVVFLSVRVYVCLPKLMALSCEALV